MDGSHSLQQAALVSRVSFEPLSLLDQQNGLTRDGSGVSAQSDSEFEAWRVSSAFCRAPCGPPATRRRPAAVAAGCLPSHTHTRLSWFSPEAESLACLQQPQHRGAHCCQSFTTAPAAAAQPQEEHPCALHNFDQIAALASNKLVAVFLDYDGAVHLAQHQPGGSLAV